MARIYGLNGIIRGRQGNNVFSVQNGTQVVKVYQPVVFNPRTINQQFQRLKFALAGRVSSATPNVAIQGMSGGNSRNKRAAFVRQLIANATITGSNGSLIASVPYENIIFSEGSLAQYATPPSITAAFQGPENVSRVVVTIPALTSNQVPSTAPDGYGEMVVVALFDTATSRLDEIQTAMRISSSQTLQFRQGRRRDCFVVTYIVPFAPMEGRTSFDTSFLEGGEDAVSLNGNSSSLLSGMRFGQSVFNSVITLAATSSMISPSPDDDTRDVVKKKTGE